jgi:thiol-disulfide isomerase/thioredoxin
MMKTHMLAMLVVGLAAGLSCMAPAQAPLKDPQAPLQAAMQSASELASLGFTESFKGVVVTNGKPNETILKGEIVLRGKAGFSGHFTMEKQEIRLVSDGTTHCLYLIGGKTYQKTGESITRPQLMTVVTKGVLNAAGTWVADFLHNNKDLLENAGSVEAKGEQNIDGTACEGYLLTYPGFDVTAWLTRSDPPALRRAEVDLQKSAQKDGNTSAANVQVDLTGWTPNVETKDSQFVFTPPDGVTEAKPGQDPLEGKAAEDFELPLLDGGTVKLSALKGKTVVLDIWATWCGPCRRAMPIVEKVTGEFADKGVVLYAVNQGEEPEAIKKFLQTAKLNPKIAMDRDNKVSQAYGASTIPRIIIVGSDGVVRKVFRGLSPQFEDELRAVLTAAVNPAAPAK